MKQARHPLETPEQRASLEARLMELAGQIEHKSLKYHYITAFRERLRAAGRTRAASPRAAAARPGYGKDRGTPGSLGQSGRRSFPNVNARTGSLLASKIVQVSTPSSAPREALLIQAILRHPWLLDDFLEEIAEFHFNDADCERLRNHILTVHQAEEHLDNEKLLGHLSRDGYGAELERIERATAHHANANFARNATKSRFWKGGVMS